MLSGQDPLEWRVRKRWLFSASAFPGSGPGPGLLCARSCSHLCLFAGLPDPRCRPACPLSAVNLTVRPGGGAGRGRRLAAGLEGPARGWGGTGTKMSNRVVCREASHAGSWYTASGPQLNAQLEGWLSQVQSTKRPARAIIAPHAGYTYCGSCAAHAYKQVDPSITHKDEFTIIPVLVGALSESKEQEFGKLFSKYLADPSNLFVVSSDFCHWGQRFRYSYYDESQGEIYRSIEHLDKMGMSIIEQLDPVSFSNYLKKYHNTICGRHPIGVLLNAITELQKNGMNMSFSFLNYAQSSQCRNWQDSSVSYAAGALTVY
uniref:protein MEMO1 isoform X4 n=1 Tax=Callithrix jacchus TaxID=9483 RepID=UPI0023DD12FF|nr:protein MEMO1 isoform X4 [Callithrix jacchus]